MFLHPKTRRTPWQHFVATSVLLMGLGCGSADNLVEGELVDEPFSVEDSNPASRMSEHENHLMVSLSQESSEQVHMVLIQIPEISDRTLHRPMPVGSGLRPEENKPWIEVSRGLKDISYRSDGARMLAMEVTDFARSSTGFIELFENEGSYAGFVDITLDEGGYLQGIFSVEP
ncbi:MAG: hypothetical protein CMH56_11185 [Myxococcales bacterium]|nr:hypothetical protein [Myxococcales bacterium]